MGAGSSTEQRSPEQPPAGSGAPTEPELRGDGPSAEATTPGTDGDPGVPDADPAAAKLLQKNGQLSTINGLTEQGDAGLQEGALDVQTEEVIVPDVGQRESEDVREKDPEIEMAAKQAVADDITPDGQEETPEVLEQIAASEEVTPPTESQTNDVGFKKVFKFVGFKFTVKKDKNEKSDTVQLLTVKKDEDVGTEESVGAGDHQEPSMESKESEQQQAPEKPQDTPKQEQGDTQSPPQADSGQVTEGGEEKLEKEPAKSPEAPSSPVTNDTASPFKKFFTQGWAGWRKKTSFRKPKEEDLEASEKKKEPELEKGDTEDTEKAADGAQEPAEGVDQARLSGDFEKVDLPLDDWVGSPQGDSEERCAPLASEVFDDKIEVQQEVVAEVHVSTGEKTTEEHGAGVEDTATVTVDSLPPEKLAETNTEPQEDPEPTQEPGKARDVCVSGGDHTQLTDLSPEDKVPPKQPEGLVSEVDMLCSQERIKAQGSPLKKLFSSGGLKKLSGKKQKGKRGGGDEEPGEHAPESPDEQKGESSASSPDEPEEITCLEKGAPEGPQEGEVEEGATSDGEKKREGITPWASFKKMVTPKKRVRRPSESDKEEEMDKVKSATLSSTESAASELQDEAKAVGDEQKPEEPKRKVDTSVSWEALICVGSSKKRARKTSSSDDEGGPRTTGGDGHQAEEASKDKEPGPDAIPAGSQDHDQGQGSSSPEQAGSPSEGEGVSTWESFKRLVTPRKKSKTKLEEKIEDSGVEHLASDAEPGKEESWVSIKKLIPGRRKKRADGKPEQATAEDIGPAEINEDDSEVPAVVPLSEYDAVEREKTEAQKSAQTSEQPVPVYVSEELSKTLVHTVSVAVIDGTRAVASVEERSPSWISTSVTEPPEQADDETTPSMTQVTARDIIAEEAPVVTQMSPESRAAPDDTVASEVELTSEAVTAAETSEALGTGELTEASGAEETTDMVSAVSQLTDSPVTTEEATPVQEVEGGVPDIEEQERRTQAVLQAVAEKVKEEPGRLGTCGPEAAIPTMQKAGLKVLEKVEETEEVSEAIGLERASSGGLVSKVPVQETDSEPVTQGSVMVQSTEVPEATASVESRELATTLQTEALDGVRSQEQAVPPDSSETLTDSETNGSTPVADLEAVDTMQQDVAIESHGDMTQITEADTAPAQKEGLPAPSTCQSQEEEEPPRTGDVLGHTEQAFPVGAVTPVVCKTEVGHFADDGVKDILCVEGLEGSAPTEGTSSEEKITEVPLDGEVSEGTECHKSENVELQSPGPEQTERGADLEREEPEAEPEQESEEPEQKAAAPPCEEADQQLVQTAELPDSERGKDESLLEGSLPHPDQQEGACLEVQVQSSDAEKVLETDKIPETGETLLSAGALLITAQKSSEEVEDGALEPRDEAVPMGPESEARSLSVGVSTTPGDALHSHLEGERSTSQKEGSDEDEQVDSQGGRERVASDGDLQAESSKLVQNVIQTAIDQFVHTEEMAPEKCASTLHTQIPLVPADDQGAGQTLDKEHSWHPACQAQGETLTTTAQEASQPDAVRPTLPDSSRNVVEPSEKMVMVELKSSGVNGQQFEEVTVLSEAEGDGNGTKPVPGDGQTKLGERVEKPPSEPKEEDKADTVVGPEESPADNSAETSGDLTKESPDTNGPKLTEEGDAQEIGKVPSESDTENKPHPENLHHQEGEPAKSQFTES